uniref:HAT C-terminal dimerisation domain-containing protein n=1 Tax=Davidia involucrata TaxID=16924 RepID=A0A5B7BHV9_DAVIN
MDPVDIDIDIEDDSVEQATDKQSTKESGEEQDVESKKYKKHHRKLTSEEFETFENREFIFSAQRSQLELYLDKSRVRKEGMFDVLAYWKAHQFRYPELAQMAHDVLSIPISTVASE